MYIYIFFSIQSIFPLLFQHYSIVTTHFSHALNLNKKDASLFYSCTQFVRGIMKINGKNDYFYRNYVLERQKDVNSHKKDACLFYSRTQFISGIMKINGKNDYFYRNYALERWKNASLLSIFPFTLNHYAAGFAFSRSDCMYISRSFPYEAFFLSYSNIILQ